MGKVKEGNVGQKRVKKMNQHSVAKFFARLL